MYMGKIIYMNTTLALFNAESIEQVMLKNEIKYLEDSFYLVIKEEEPETTN